MRIKITQTTVKLWLSKSDTEAWATRPGMAWPCSSLRGKRLFAEFDRTGLLDLTINGQRNTDKFDINGHEFSAITSDYIAVKLPETHPAFYGTVGQYLHSVKPMWTR